MVLSRRLAFCVLLLVVALTFLSFFGTYEEGSSSSTTHRRLAVVYGGPTFHDEVVSSVACLLHEQGFYVTVYVGSGLSLWGFPIPFSGKRRRSSMAFYGVCVDRWITIVDPISTFVMDPDLLVFVTYPMLRHNFKLDVSAFLLLEQLKEQKAHTQVVLITHRSNEMQHESLPFVEALVDKSHLSFLFMGQHTEAEAVRLMQDKRLAHTHVTSSQERTNTSSLKNAARAVTSEAEYRTGFFYPVMPLEFVGLYADRQAYSRVLKTLGFKCGCVLCTCAPSPLAPYSTDGIRMQTFSMQGNFGGKHAHRKNVKGTVDCLRVLEGADAIDAQLGTSRNENESTYNKLTNKGARRRRLEAPFSPSTSLRTIESKNSRNSSSISSSRSIDQGDSWYKGRAYVYAPTAHPLRLSLDLIGHIAGQVEAGSLSKGSVRFASDLSSSEYYRAISHSRFMLAAVGDKEYLTSRATSSVPAALIAHVPLVTSKQFLYLYPCLRDSKMHLHIAKENECESIEAAARLTFNEYEQLKQEIVGCSNQMWQQGKDLFQSIASLAQKERAQQREK